MGGVKMAIELIDTLWNVNKSLALTVSPVFRINRYIMECKSYFFLTFCGWSFELIDTLWNVNKSIKCAVSGSVLELIDTLWNVNVTDATAINKMETELIDTLWNVNLSTIAYHCGYFAN